MFSGNRLYWVIWGLITIGLGVFLILKLTGNDKGIYLPGKTTHGHYQIEMACDACHTDPMGGGKVLQQACMNCHGEELKIADDSHPKSKFTNPRNTDRVAKLDARQCVTCHSEHRKEITLGMGVTLPEDFCFKCHQDVGDNRPSHKGMTFNTCAASGCHNFHDNRGLYEDFLAKHLDEPDNLKSMIFPELSLREAYQATNNYPVDKYPIKELGLTDSDQPPSVRKDSKILQDWMDTAHSKSGVNCTACHMEKQNKQAKSVWVDKPTYKVCGSCHADHNKGFLSGRHGMRLAQDFSPMTPALARIPMKKNAHSEQLDCVSCHSSHRFDTRHAAVDACLGCHNDKHSKAYKDSAHFGSWRMEINGQSEKNTGVSCASCHMPRKAINRDGKTFITVEHNQNDNLRPNEKMLRSVCMQCHGLGFAIDSLADANLIETNFSTKPGKHVESLDLVKKRKGLKKDIEGM